jgi:DsbC/DsbD-like thiol-disulfide interchange protein
MLAVVLLSGPAHAAATDWQDLAPDTRIRLIASERLEGQKTHAAIELDMPSGTKTYWRVPGETGIPLQLDLTGSSGVGAHRVAWPFPRIEVKDGYTDFVLYGPTVIPIELEVTGATALLEADVLLGVCSEICVPATASFSLPLDFGKPDPGQSVRIDQALALTAIDWTGADAPVAGVAFDIANERLSVEIDAGRLEASMLIVDASEAGYVFGAPQKSPEPNLVVYDMLGGGDAGALEGKAVRIVFMTDDGPYEVTRRVDPLPGG